MSKISSRLPGPEYSYGKIVIPVTEISGRKNRDLGKPGQAGYLCEHAEIFTKERVERRDLETTPARRKSA